MRHALTNREPNTTPDLNRRWRFCRQGRDGYLVDSSCFLVGPTRPFSPVVVPANPDLIDTLGVVFPASILTPWRVCRPRRVPNTVVPQPRRLAAGDPGAPSPAGRPASLGEATKGDHRRSAPLGMPLSHLARLAISARHRQARHRHRMASQGVLAVLDMEGPSRAARKTSGSIPRPPADPPNEPRESALGRATHPWELRKLGIKLVRRVSASTWAVGGPRPRRGARS